MDRLHTIDRVLNDLHKFLKQTTPEREYAVKENIRFFKALRSKFSYVLWFLFHAPFIDPKKLEELSDFGMEEWDISLHRGLMHNSKNNPWFIRDLCDASARYLVDHQAHFMVNLGCGAMDVELKMIKEYNEKFPNKIVFVGIDKSTVTQKLAQENFASISSLVDFKTFRKDQVDELLILISQKHDKHQIVYLQEDFSVLFSRLQEKSIPLVIHSRFLHHLTLDQTRELRHSLYPMAQTVIEFDECRSWIVMYIISTKLWNMPVLMNGAIFSRLRESTVAVIKKQSFGSLKIIKPLMYYLRVIENK